MMWTLLLIVGGAALSAALLRRFAGGFVRGNPQVMTGIAVAGLLLVAVAAMRGMQPRLLADPGGVAVMLAVAFAINIALQALGTLLFLRAGAAEALTAGLVSGNRNVTLAWAAAGMGPGRDRAGAGDVRLPHLRVAGAVPLADHPPGGTLPGGGP